MPIRRFSHFGICVSDPQRSLRFYRDMLGFRPVSRVHVDDAASAQLLGLDPLDLRATVLERDGARIELLHFAAPGHERGDVPRPMNRVGLTHMALRVDDLADLLVELEAAGVEILHETRIQNAAYESDVVYVLDPDGVRIELVQMPGDPNRPVGERIE
jgi:lactoylglutathione lyase